MALSFSTCSSNLGLVAAKSKPSLLPQPLPKLHLVAISQSSKSCTRSLFYANRTSLRRLCAQEKSNEGSTPSSDKTELEESEDQSQSQAQVQTDDVEEGSMTEVAAELKQMLKEKKEREQQDDSLLTGVVQEVREIEWPDLGKVLGTTGVVLAVIAGSTAALLSVNAILAELSDQVFAGKGIQDFF